MILSKEKPHITGSQRKKLQRRKWEHALEVKKEFEAQGIPVITFDRSKSTPHLRIDDKYDYWPASSRFIDLDLGLWGLGFEDLKKYILLEKSK